MQGPWILRVLGGVAAMAVLSVTPSVTGAETIKLAVISESASNWPLYVAQAKKLFEKERLDVQITVTRSSDKQVQAMNKGEFDIGHLATDHIIRTVEKGSELFLFMALNRPVFSLVTAPTITSFQDLKGKALAVDGARTGYALLLKEILAQKGLKEEDYTFTEVGGTNERYAAVRSGAVAAGLIQQPFDKKLFSEGFKSLGNTADYFPNYQGSAAATKRSWAAKNENTLIRYIRAYVAASDWLFDPKNRQEAIEILANRLKIDQAQASDTYEGTVGRALIPKAKVNLDGFRQVLEVTWEAEGFKPPLPSPEKYVDLSYYSKAVSQR